MTKAEAKHGLRVIDDFGAVGTIKGNVYGQPHHRFVSWDGDDPSEPSIVHVSRIRIADQ